MKTDYSKVDREPHTAPECPACGNDGAELGTLGALRWHRCWGCGLDQELKHRHKLELDELLNK